MIIYNQIKLLKLYICFGLNKTIKSKYFTAGSQNFNIGLFCFIFVDAAIVFVSMSDERQYLYPAGDPLPLNKTITMKGNPWDLDTYSFNVTQATAGLYFVALSVGAPKETQVEYILNKSGRRFGGITRTSVTHKSIEGYFSSDIISHDFIISLYSGDTLHVSSQNNVYSSPKQRDTSLSIFSLTHTMLDETAAFCVASNHTISGYRKPVPFNTYLYNAGRHYNPLNHTYTAPSDGIYYFSFSVGLNAHSEADFILYKNDKAYINIYRNSTAHNGTDTIGRAVMMWLDRGDRIYMVNEAGRTARSSPMMETSFSGFKYQPKHGNMVH